MLYLDSSSCLKLLWLEPESQAVAARVAEEQDVFISKLAELEVAVQLRAAWLGGEYSRSRYGSYSQRFGSLRGLAPFRFKDLSGSIFTLALQRLADREGVHLRTLDRLHLAAMEELGARRIMTHDRRLAEVAKHAGLVVLTPQ